MTNHLSISLHRGHSSSDVGRPSRTLGLVRSAKRILSLFLPRKMLDHHQRPEDKVKMSNREAANGLVGVESQATRPTNRRASTVNDVSKAIDGRSNHPDVPMYENSGSYRFENSSRRTDGSNSDSASSSSRKSAGISTVQTTSSDPQTEFTLHGDDEDIRATSLDRISQVDLLSPVSTNSEYNEDVFMVGSNPAKKLPALMALDTQASANLMSVELQQELELEIEHCDQEIVPLQTKTGKNTIKPVGIAKGVPWHFAQREKTFTSDFLVVDMKDYDAILGRQDIRRWKILKSGPGLERRTTIRCPAREYVNCHRGT